MSDVFLSYSTKDRDIASTIVARLEESEISVWWDRQLPLGQDFEEEIQQQLNSASCVVALWSKNSVESSWVKGETTDAAERGILIPVLIQDVKPPIPMRPIQTANLIGWDGLPNHPEFEKILKSIRAHIINRKPSKTGLREKEKRSLNFRQVVDDYKIRILDIEYPSEARRIVEQWKMHSSNPSVHLVPFESQSNRRDLPEKPISIRTANNTFPLRVYCPPKSSALAPFSRYYLIYNGLGESLPTIYDAMCTDLATRKNVPVIFMPLPLHYCRHHAFVSKDVDPYEPHSTEMSIATSQRIFQGIAAKPELLIYSFKQTLDDTRRLVDTIKSGHHPYWKEILSKDATLSLFGYSFGGFSALAYMLLAPEHIEKVFLFESGGFIDQIDASVLFHRRISVAKALWNHYYIEHNPIDEWEPLFSNRDSEQGSRRLFEEALSERVEHKLASDRPKALSQKDETGEYIYKEPYRIFIRSDDESRELWQDVMATLYKKVDEVPDLNKEERALFSQIYLGHERVTYRRQLDKQQDKILVISGGADEIFPTRKLLELGPETGLALLQVPGITHWVKYRSEDRWRQWQQKVVDIMETFSFRR